MRKLTFQRPDVAFTYSRCFFIASRTCTNLAIFDRTFAVARVTGFTVYQWNANKMRKIKFPDKKISALRRLSDAFAFPPRNTEQDCTFCTFWVISNLRYFSRVSRQILTRRNWRARYNKFESQACINFTRSIGQAESRGTEIDEK